MSTVLTELFRHSFPKGLRFCGQCKMMHSSLLNVINRNKNKRYIPRAEINAVVNTFEPAPYGWMRNWVLRKIFFLNFFNQMRRGISKKPLWILSPSLQIEHNKLKAWLERYEATGGNVAEGGFDASYERMTGSKGSFATANAAGTNDTNSTANQSSSAAAPNTSAASPNAKKGKWSASKYARSAPTSSIPARSDKSAANTSLDATTRGAAADLAEEANRAAAPKAAGVKKSLYEQSLFAMRAVFGGSGSSITAAGASSSTAAGEGAETASAAASSTSAGAKKPTAGGSRPSHQHGGAGVNRNVAEFVEREAFEKTFMPSFQVAMYYHLTFIFGAFLLLFALLQLVAIVYAHTFFYWRLKYFTADHPGQTVDGIVGEHVKIEAAHLTVEIPAEFQSQIPPPAVVMTAKDAPQRRLQPMDGDDARGTVRSIIDPRTGAAVNAHDGNNRVTNSAEEEAGRDDKSNVYVLNAVELTSPNKKVKVIFIPSPVIGLEGFFKEMGAILKQADVVLLEGVSLNETHRQSASTFFPLHESFFAPYKLSHRYYDVLSSDREPPMLLPAATPASWSRWIQLLFLPFPIVMVHMPHLMVGSKGEARIGWSWLVDGLDMVADMDLQKGPSMGANGGAAAVGDDNPLGVMNPSAHSGLMAKAGAAVVAIPWTVNQIANIEASLVNKGYTVTGVLPMRWMEVGQMGRAFADYYGVTEGNSGPIVE